MQMLHALEDVLRHDVLDRDLADPGRSHAEPLLRSGYLLQHFQRLGVYVNRRAIVRSLRLDGVDGDTHRVSQNIDLRDQVRRGLIHVTGGNVVPHVLGDRLPLDHPKRFDDGGEDASPVIHGRIDGQAGSPEQSQTAKYRHLIGSYVHLAFSPSGLTGMSVAEWTPRFSVAMTSIRCGSYRQSVDRPERRLEPIEGVVVRSSKRTPGSREAAEPANGDGVQSPPPSRYAA